MRSLTHVLIILSLVFALVLAQSAAPATTSSAPATPATSAAPAADASKKKAAGEEEDATITDIIAEYNKNEKKSDFFVRQISFEKAEDVTKLINFLASDDNKAQRVVISSVYDLKEEQLVSIIRDGISKTKALTAVGIAKINVGTTGCAALAQLIAQAPATLDKVHLYRSGINAACLSTLIESGYKKNTAKSSLTKFVSIENSLGDEGFKLLADFASSADSNIKELLVRDASLTVASAKVAGSMLEKSTKLTHVDISENPKLTEGFADIMKGLEKSTTVSHFEFNYGELKREHLNQLIEVVKKNKVLSRLDLSENEIGNGGVEDLAKAITEDAKTNSIGIKRLDLSSCEVEDEAATKLVQALVANPKAIGVLHFFRNEINTNATQELLQKNGNVVKSEFMTEEQVIALEKEESAEEELADLDNDVEEKFVEDDADVIDDDEDEASAEEDEDAGAGEDEEAGADEGDDAGAAGAEDAEEPEEDVSTHNFLGNKPKTVHEEL